MGSLPQSAAFLVPKHYDYLTVETEGSQSGCIVMPLDSSVLNSTSRFAVEPASSGLVHIRSCYNNKYLRRLSEESSLIAAAASEREEATAKWSCTLFRPEMKESSLVELYHVGTEKMVSLDWNNDLRGPLILAGPELTRIGSFQVVDVAAIVRLPKRVSFKGDNGKYLCSRIQDGVPYNSFLGDDNSEEVSHYEISETRHAEIYIRSLHTKKFLRYDNSGWIVADVASIEADNYKDYPSETFKVVKLGDNVIALRNKVGEFCKRVEDESGKKNCLKACQESKVVHEGRFVVGEPVFDRRIYVQFDFKHAKIYGKEASQTATISVVNGTDQKHELAQGFSYTKIHRATWETSNEIKIGTEASISAGVPFIANESLKLSTEYTRGWTQGESEDYSKQLTSTYTVPVPAKTKATVNLISEEARYDVPYSYYQTDTYTNGEKITTFMNDGIYHGVEAYNFYYEPKYEPLVPKSDKTSDGKSKSTVTKS